MLVIDLVLRLQGEQSGAASSSHLCKMESRAQREAELEQASEEIAKKKAAHHSRNTSSDRGLGSPSFEDRPGEEEARSGRGPERGPAPRLDKRTMSTTSLVSIKSEQSVRMFGAIDVRMFWLHACCCECTTTSPSDAAFGSNCDCFFSKESVVLKS